MRAHDGGRLRQYPRPAAAAPHHAAGSQPGGRRNNDDVVPALGVGGASRVRTPCGQMEPSPSRHRRTGLVHRRPQFHRRCDHATDARADSDHRRPGGRRIPSARRNAGAQTRRGHSRAFDVGLHQWRHIGVLLWTLALRAVRRTLRDRVDTAPRHPGARGHRVFHRAGAEIRALIRRRCRTSRTASLCQAAGAALHDRGAPHDDVHCVRNVSAGDADATWHECRRRRSRRRQLSVREWRGWVPRWPGG